MLDRANSVIDTYLLRAKRFEVVIRGYRLFNYKTKGAERARRYKADLAGLKHADNLVVVARLYDDCMRADGPLGSSTELRDALIIAVLDHLKISKQARHKAECEAMKSIPLAALGGSPALIAPAIRSARLKVIREEMQRRNIELTQIVSPAMR